MFDLVEHEIQAEVFDVTGDIEHAKSFKRSEGDSVVEFVKQYRAEAEA
jgi:hypothetical protein